MGGGESKLGDNPSPCASLRESKKKMGMVLGRRVGSWKTNGAGAQEK